MVIADDTAQRAIRSAKAMYPNASGIVAHAQGPRALVLVAEHWVVRHVRYFDFDRLQTPPKPP
jgi:hypothetical protein